MIFKKPCRDCGEMFRPAGRSTRYCNKCLKKRYAARAKKNKESRIKKQLSPNNIQLTE